MNFKITSLILLILGTGTSSAFAAECQTKGSFVFGADASQQTQVKSGESCHHGLHTRGLISGVRIVTPAKNGTATASDAAWDYTANPGFVGADSFVVAITGETMKAKGTTNVTVTVNVTK